VVTWEEKENENDFDEDREYSRGNIPGGKLPHIKTTKATKKENNQIMSTIKWTDKGIKTNL